MFLHHWRADDVATYSGRFESKPDDIYPAAYMPVQILWRGQFSNVGGLVDTGATQTLLPRLRVTALGITPVSDVDLVGIDNVARKEDTYIVDLDVGPYRIRNIEVSVTDWEFALIGRDILNDLVMNWNGPGLTFDLDDTPSTTAPATTSP